MYFIFFFCLLGVLSISGIVCSILNSNTAKNTLNTFDITEERIVSDVNIINSTAAKWNHTSIFTPDIKNVFNWIQKFAKTKDEHNEDINTSTNVGTYSLLSIFILGLVIPFVGIISVVCRIRWMITCIIILSIIFLPIIWTTAGTVVPIAVFTADMCSDIENYVQNRTAMNNTTWIQYYTTCVGANPLHGVENTVNSYLVEAQGELNYTKTHDPNNQVVIAELEQLIEDIEKVLLRLNDLSDCKKFQDSYSQIKSDICLTTINLIAVLFILYCVSGIVLFSSVWSALKFSVVLVHPNVYAPINQDPWAE